jgi:hypothetical protein
MAGQLAECRASIIVASDWQQAIVCRTNSIFFLGKNSSLTEFIRCKWVGVVVVCVRGVGGAGVGSRRPTV